MPFTNCLEGAKLRLDRANADAKLRGMKPVALNRVSVLARMLSGDFLKADKSGPMSRQYFELVKKKDRWFWIWYKGPHALYEPSTFEDLGEISADKTKKAERVKKSKDVDAHVPFSAIAAVNSVSGEDRKFLVQYRTSTRAGGSPYIKHGRRPHARARGVDTGHSPLCRHH